MDGKIAALVGKMSSTDTVARRQSGCVSWLRCAIDIDAYANPRMYGPLGIDVFNYAAKQGGVNCDFGKSVLSDKERGNGDYSEDDVMEILNRVNLASNAVRNWLRLHLPRYRRLQPRSKAPRSSYRRGIRQPPRLKRD